MSAATNTYGSFSYQKTFHTSPYQETTEVTVVANSAWAHPYQSGVVVPKMEQNIQVNTTSQTPQAPRFLLGNAANFQGVEPNYYGRPLLMDAWAQTNSEDFCLLTDEHRDRVDFLRKENEALREKVHLLESDLRVHSDLLNQIHATAALKTRVHESMEHISHTPPATPVMNNNIKYNDIQQYVNQQHISPAQASYLATQSYSPQVMNSMQSNSGIAITSTESVKYTIVSNSREKHENQSVEPIEIQLAEDDGALNLNSSADSGRLEICLGEHEANQTQEAAHFKTEVMNGEHTLPPLPAQSGILIKRSRVNSQRQNKTAQVEHQTRTPVRLQEQSNKRKKSMENSKGSSPMMKEQSSQNALRHLQDENVMVTLGPNNTRVPYKVYESINWNNPSLATRKLLTTLFDRPTLASHSMTGKPSPAFKSQPKPRKERLDPRVTEDIIYVVTRRSKVSAREVRNAITTKCADENKMEKMQEKKIKKAAQSGNSTDKENQNNIQEKQMY